MTLAWGWCWGRSRRLKACVFPCNVAAADEERYLVCAAGAGALVLRFLLCRGVAVASRCFKLPWMCLCVRLIGCFIICVCRSHWNGCTVVATSCCHVRRYTRVCHVIRKTHCDGCMKVARRLFWGRSRSTKACVFPCAVAAASGERSLVCGCGRARSEVFASPRCSCGLKMLQAALDVSV